MDRTPKPGEFYRHFKDKYYQIITLAKHSETGEQLVIYQALYGDFSVYARPLSMFVSEVDHEKYPDAGQKYRFEKARPADKKAAGTGLADEKGRKAVLAGGSVRKEAGAEETETINPLVLSFAEAEDYERRMEILMAMKGKAGQRELDILYTILDLPQRPGDVGEQLEAVRQYLEMQRKYDGNRLR